MATTPGAIPNTPPGTPGQPGAGADPNTEQIIAGQSSSTGGNRTGGVQAHHAFALLIAEICFIGVVSIYASQGAANRRTALGLVGILWLIFMMANYQTIQNYLKSRGIIG